jgi:hypothetical protein
MTLSANPYISTSSWKRHFFMEPCFLWTVQPYISRRVGVVCSSIILRPLLHCHFPHLHYFLRFFISLPSLLYYSTPLSTLLFLLLFFCFPLLLSSFSLFSLILFIVLILFLHHLILFLFFFTVIYVPCFLFCVLCVLNSTLGITEYEIGATYRNARWRIANKIGNLLVIHFV